MPTIAVRYYSKTGHTEAVAIPIGEAVHADALPISSPLPGGFIDVLFLGGAPYAWHAARPMRNFIETLNPASIGAVAIFTTSGDPRGAYKIFARLCEKRGLHVLPMEYHCKGDAAKKPQTAEDAAHFAARVVAYIESKQSNTD